jgi:hypothetical protein
LLIVIFENMAGRLSHKHSLQAQHKTLVAADKIISYKASLFSQPVRVRMRSARGPSHEGRATQSGSEVGWYSGLDSGN